MTDVHRAMARHLFIALVIVTGIAGKVSGQPYPARAVTIVLPFAPGSGLDVIAHLVGTRLSETLGQPVIIDNRPGAGGMVGSEFVARAAPDGHTLLMGNNSTYGVNQAFNPASTLDIVKDYTPITIVSVVPELMMLGPRVPANSVKEFIALAKDKPGQLNFASAGTGSNTHLMAELFKYVTGVNIVHVPYKGSGPAMTAAMGGEVQLLFAVASGAMPSVKSGRLKAVGITGTKRSPLRPELQTLAEQGVKGFETGVTYAVVGPAGMPRAIVTRLNQEIVKIVNTADVKEKFLEQSTESVGSTPEACAEFIRSELAKWSKLIKETGIRAE